MFQINRPIIGLVIPRSDHVVIVIEENHSYPQIIGVPAAPYINSLAQQGALLTQFSALTRPSQPNYLALFSGSTQGITDNACPLTFSTPNLRDALTQTGYTFGGGLAGGQSHSHYDLPSTLQDRMICRRSGKRDGPSR